MEKPHIPGFYQNVEVLSEFGFTRPGQRRRYQCFRYLSSDSQHPAVKKGIVTVSKIGAR